MDSMDLFLRSLEKEIAIPAGHSFRGELFETISSGVERRPPSTVHSGTKHSDALHSHYRIQGGAEITVETNPGTVDAEKLRGYRSLGVNRLSIGIQSFHPDELKFLSRIHTADEATACIENAYRAGFDNVSVDLIFSLPNQTLERWKESLRRAAALQPKHLSAYSLIVEAAYTALYNGAGGNGQAIAGKDKRYRDV